MSSESVLLILSKNSRVGASKLPEMRRLLGAVTRDVDAIATCSESSSHESGSILKKSATHEKTKAKRTKCLYLYYSVDGASSQSALKKEPNSSGKTSKFELESIDKLLFFLISVGRKV